MAAKSVSGTAGRRVLPILLLLVVGFGLQQFFYGEKIPVNHGFGWDGHFYGAVASNFPTRLFSEPPGQGISSYYVQRILPSGVVYYGLRLFGVPTLTQTGDGWVPSENLIVGFEVYNLILLALTAWFWVKVLRRLELRAGGMVLGCIGLFLNFAVLKNYFYYPVSTDPTALLLGTLLLYCFLADKRLGLVVVTVVGAFCWPTALYAGALLIAFPRRDFSAEPAGAARPVAVSIVLAAVMVPAMLYASRLPAVNGSSPVDRHWLIVSMCVELAYVVAGAWMLVKHTGLVDPRAVWRQIRWHRILLAAALLVVVKLAQHAVADPAVPLDSNTSVSGYLGYVVRNGLLRPFSFFVSHVAFFGPVMLLALFAWGRVSRVVGRYGLGLVLFFFANLVLSLVAESRELTLAFPFLVAFTVKALDGYPWSTKALAAFAVISVAVSKVWYPINPIEGLRLLEFPMQRYLMNFGPWMSGPSYVYHALGFVLTAAATVVLLRRSGFWGRPTRRKAEPAPEVQAESVRANGLNTRPGPT
jgi:hypothetical protein